MDTLVIQDSFEPYYSGRNHPPVETRKECSDDVRKQFKTAANRSNVPADSLAKTRPAREH